MNYLAHLVAGLAVVGAAALALGIPFTPQLAAVAVLGASLPDVDCPKTRIFRVTAALIAVAVFVFAKTFFEQIPQLDAGQAVVFALVCGVAALAVVYLIKPRHRGVTHSLAALAVFSAVVFLLTKNSGVALAGGLAYASHLIADREIKAI